MAYDLIIIGSGPAGYVAAIRAGQLGKKVLVIDEKYIGGMCLNWGCIPTKALLESAKFMHKILQAKDFGIDGIDPDALSFNWQTAQKRADAVKNRLVKGIEFLWKKNNAEFMQGRAEIIDANHVQVNYIILETANILIATGSIPAPLPQMPQDRILELADIMHWDKLPTCALVYGKGATAVEMTQFLHFTGVDVHLVCPSSILLPEVDGYLSDAMEKRFNRDRIQIFKTDQVEFISATEARVENVILPCEKIINCSGRKPVIPPSQVQLPLDGFGFIQVNEHFETPVPHIFAIGDVNGKSVYAHIASAQALAVVNYLEGFSQETDFSHYPINIYSEPELAQIGFSEQQLQIDKIEYKVSEFTLRANGKALTEGASEGFIRILSENHYGEVLGVQIMAEHATDLIAEASLLMEMEGTVYDVARTIHAHPTVPEVFMEAGLAAIDEPLHK
jgi:dihydrolipoamide dehydrogenase